MRSRLRIDDGVMDGLVERGEVCEGHRQVKRALS